MRSPVSIDYFVVIDGGHKEAASTSSPPTAPPPPPPPSESTLRKAAFGSARRGARVAKSSARMDSLFTSLASTKRAALFPAPGKGAAGLVRMFDQAPKPPPPPTGPTAAARKAAATAAKAAAKAESARSGENRKTMMMPDKKCRVCYECDQPFTVIKRRHHCRMCGQIFCNKCSSQRIDGRQITGESLVRVCDACHTLYSNRQSILSESAAAAAAAASPASGAATTLESAAAASAAAAATAAAPMTPPSGYSPHARPISVTGARAHRSRCLSNMIPAKETFETYVTELREGGARRSGARDALSLAALAAMNPASPERPDSPQLIDDDVSSSSADSVARTRRLHVKALQRYSHMRLRAAVVAMLNASPALALLPDDRRDEWATVLTELVGKGASDIGAHQTSMDVRDYFKVKVIAGGGIDECRIVHGVVFRKDLADRKMERNVSKANLLLLACAIQHDRIMKISNLDQLVEQEERHMEIKVGMITALRPHVVMVEQNVSQHALGLLLKAGVGVVLRLKRSTMERIGRHIGAPLLDSVDMLSHDSDNFFGQCGSFYVRSYSISPQDHPERSGNTVYMFVEGCPPERGVTLLLRGETKNALRALKGIARRAVVRARHLRFETSLLCDVGISVPHSVFAALRLESRDAHGVHVEPSTRLRVDNELDALRRSMEKEELPRADSAQWIGVLRTHEDAGLPGSTTPYEHAQVEPSQWKEVNFYTQLGAGGERGGREHRESRGERDHERSDLTLLQYLKNHGRLSSDFKNRISYSAESGEGRLHTTLELVAPPEPELTRAAQESNPNRDERLNFSMSRDSTPLIWVWCCKCGSVLREPAALSADTLAISYHRFVTLMLGSDGVPAEQRCVLPCCGSKVATHAMWFICRSPIKSRGAHGDHAHHGEHTSVFGDVRSAVGGGAGGSSGGGDPRWLLSRFEHERTQPFSVRTGVVHTVNHSTLAPKLASETSRCKALVRAVFHMKDSWIDAVQNSWRLIEHRRWRNVDDMGAQMFEICVNVISLKVDRRKIGGGGGGVAAPTAEDAEGGVTLPYEARAPFVRTSLHSREISTGSGGMAVLGTAETGRVAVTPTEGGGGGDSSQITVAWSGTDGGLLRLAAPVAPQSIVELHIELWDSAKTDDDDDSSIYCVGTCTIDLASFAARNMEEDMKVACSLRANGEIVAYLQSSIQFAGSTEAPARFEMIPYSALEFLRVTMHEALVVFDEKLSTMSEGEVFGIMSYNKWQHDLWFAAQQWQARVKKYVSADAARNTMSRVTSVQSLSARSSAQWGEGVSASLSRIDSTNDLTLSAGSRQVSVGGGGGGVGSGGGGDGEPLVDEQHPPAAGATKTPATNSVVVDDAFDTTATVSSLPTSLGRSNSTGRSDAISLQVLPELLQWHPGLSEKREGGNVVLLRERRLFSQIKISSEDLGAQNTAVVAHALNSQSYQAQLNDFMATIQRGGPTSSTSVRMTSKRRGSKLAVGEVAHGILGSRDGGSQEEEEKRAGDATAGLKRNRIEQLVKVLCSKVLTDIELKMVGATQVILPTSAASAAVAAVSSESGLFRNGSSDRRSSGSDDSRSHHHPEVGNAAASFASGALEQQQRHVGSADGTPSDRTRDDVLSAARSFSVTAFWSAQFAALRQLYLGDESDDAFIESLSCCKVWRAKGGKSDAEFMKVRVDLFFIMLCNSILH